jgi:glutaredoxin
MNPLNENARVVVYTRTGCHLCEDALRVVSAVCDKCGESFALVDIDSDADLVARFTDEVPVVFVDGRQHAFWRVDAGRLRAALTGPK